MNLPCGEGRRQNPGRRARWLRLGGIQHGDVTAEGPLTADGAAGVGDRIVTRHNDRTLRHGPGNRQWVRNGDTWTVTTTHPDGSLTATTTTGSTITLDAGYVHTHVHLGYAVTAHAAQGRTVDTAHTLITRATTREALYVAATRGRHTNTLTITTTHPTPPPPPPPSTTPKPTSNKPTPAETSWPTPSEPAPPTPAPTPQSTRNTTMTSSETRGSCTRRRPN